jgi:hypothetical protein
VKPSDLVEVFMMSSHFKRNMFDSFKAITLIGPYKSRQFYK